MKNFKIVISPSKTFNLNKEAEEKLPRPKNILMAKEIFGKIRSWDINKTKEVYKLSDKMTKDVYEMHQAHGQKLYYAIEMYGGEVFKQLKLDEYDKEWLNNHVVILDALYGVVKPYDTIAPYRLDFNVKFDFDLKNFWKETINNDLKDFELYNLASKEFSSLIDLPMTEVELEKASTIKKQRGLTLHKIIKNKKA